MVRFDISDKAINFDAFVEVGDFTKSGDKREILVAHIAFHPDFVYVRGIGTDIAVLTLSESVDRRSVIGLCRGDFAMETTKTKIDLVFCGMGKLSRNTKQYPKFLQEAQLREVGPDECEVNWPWNPRKQICTARYVTTYGDSGNPLFPVLYGEAFCLYGVQSAIYLFERVGAHADWIRQQM